MICIPIGKGQTMDNAENTQASPAAILVWDVPVRVFHWLLVVCFAGAYLTSENEEWRLVHVTLGYTMAGLIVFRLVWGFIGSRYARWLVRAAGIQRRTVGRSS